MVSACQEDGFKNVWVVLMTILNSALLQHFIRTHICKQMCCMQCAMHVLLLIRTQTQLQHQLSASLLTVRFLTTGGATVCLKERGTSFVL